MSEPEAYRWQRPQAYLYALDLAHDRAWFLDLERETLLHSGFLDQRIAADVSAHVDVPIEELLAQPIHGAAADTGYIFHTAFCCSTLLARSLDLPGRSLVLREPAPLLELADLARGLIQARREVSELLSPTLDLLARPFAAGERIIVKPTNLANNLAPSILALRPRSRALLLYDELEAFLLAVLKRPRESERGIGQFLDRFLADPPGRAWAATHALPQTLGERAALAWTLQIRGLKAWIDETPGANLRILAASELLASPAAALMASAAWFGMTLTREEAAAIPAGPLWQSHAKHPAHAYTPARRREEQALARRLFAAPLASALAWAEKTLGIREAGFPPALRLLA